jgi:AcrR family transcriptional regulator
MPAAVTADTPTRERILDAAERMFADIGYEATSLRAITKAAEANLAAVNYYFRSKEDLAKAVMLRRLEPLNNARLALLEEYEAQAGKKGTGVPLEKIVEAFARPVLELNADRDIRIQPLLGRMYAEPGPIRDVFANAMTKVAERFFAALRRALPGLHREDFFWRVHFMIGALAHTMAGRHLLEFISNGCCDPTDTEAVTGQYVQFVCAGLRGGAGES